MAFGQLLFKLKKDYPLVTADTVKSEIRFFMPYEALPAQYLEKIKQGAQSPVNPASLTSNISPQSQSDSGPTISPFPEPGMSDEAKKELFDKMYGDFEEGRTYVEGITNVILLIL